MPKEHTRKAKGDTPMVRRQVPVSCTFCRSRKLRCSRTQPCSNCEARGVTCRQEHPSQSPQTSESTEIEPGQADILARLRRLEQIVLNQQPVENLTESIHSLVQHQDESVSTEQPPSVHDDIAWLERVSMGPNSHVQSYVQAIVFRICPVKDIVKAPKFSFDPGRDETPTRCIWLPPHAEAKTIVESYIQHASYKHHVLHLPSLPTMIDEIYALLDYRCPTQLGPICLLLSIIANVTYTCAAHGNNCDVLTTAEAHKQTGHWIQTTQDVLSAAQSSFCLSLELVQAIIIVSFVLGNLEGVGLRYRSLLFNGMLLAREIGLHRVDDPRIPNTTDTIQAEIRRRVWWYLVATDWLLAARYGGYGEGVYQCNPHQMTVDKPRNVNDSDLSEGSRPQDHPISQLTEMSYSLQRIRLAEITRKIIDHKPCETSNAGIPNYADILAADADLDRFVREFPSFFNIQNIDNVADHNYPGSLCASDIVVQTYLLNSLAYIARCRLHLPYLTGNPNNALFAHSRKICLDTARALLNMEKRVEKFKDSLFIRTRSEYSGCLYGAFLACIVLLMDVCVNRPEKGTVGEEIGRQEVAEAFRHLEQAKRGSPAAANLLDSLKQLLRKHKVPPPHLDIDVNPKMTESSHTSTNAIDNAFAAGGGGQNDANVTEGQETSYLDELTLSLGDWMAPDGFPLNDFLSDLDSSFM